MDRFQIPIRRIIFGTSVKESGAGIGRVQINPRIESMLSQPSWSVRSLLPDKHATEAPTVTKKQLHHLLKLSALPLPKSKEQEDSMLKNLESQIHFVKEVQKIDTTNVEPFVAIRDETAENIEEQTISLDKLQPYLDREERVGANGTIRRPKPKTMLEHSDWDPFEMGQGKESRKKGKYFFVKKDKSRDAT